MSITQRRNSQRLASTLDALSADLDFEATEVEVETDENISAGEKSPQEYWEGKAKGDEAIQLLGQDQEIQEAVTELEETTAGEEEDVQQAEDYEFEQAFQAAMAEDDEQGETASILQGDPGVDEVGSQATFDTDEVRSLGSDYGVDFNGDQDLQDSIRQIPGRAEREAKIKKLIARIENVANEFEATGRKSLAYRLDVICNNLEAKYLNK